MGIDVKFSDAVKVTDEIREKLIDLMETLTENDQFKESRALLSILMKLSIADSIYYDVYTGFLEKATKALQNRLDKEKANDKSDLKQN